MALQRLLRQLNLKRLPKRDTVVTEQEALDQIEHEWQEMVEAMEQIQDKEEAEELWYRID